MNKEQPSAKNILRAMRDTILDATPKELDEAIHGIGLDKNTLANAGENAVTNALKVFRDQQDDNKVIMLHKCLASFLTLLRRREGMDEEELATKARVDAEEIRRMEYDTHYMPQPRTLYNLEKVFNLPIGALAKLSGAIQAQDTGLQEHAQKFAANAKAMGRLTKQEKKLLGAFVQYLTEQK